MSTANDNSPPAPMVPIVGTVGDGGCVTPFANFPRPVAAEAEQLQAASRQAHEA